jgi:hypothetical protein
VYNLLDFFGGLVLLFSTRDKYKCFATSVLVIFMIVELYATFFFLGWGWGVGVVNLIY